MQREALIRAGVLSEDIYSDDGVSGSRRVRPGLSACLARLASGDTLVVWKLDRLGRGMLHLMEMVEGFTARGIGFRSLTEEWDTGTPMGKAMFRIGCVFAELERDMIRQRVSAGVRRSREQRSCWGRPKAASSAQIAALRASGIPASAIAQRLGISVATVYRHKACP